MTKEGYAVISDEIDRLWTKERPMVCAEVSAAAEQGDRSENAAYIYGKKRMRNIDSRLRYLRKKIDGVRVVDLAEMPQFDVVKFGAIVTVENEDGEQITYRLVDREESDPKRRRISVQSPVGMALVGKREGDVARVRLPSGLAELEVVGLRYGSGDP